MGEKIALGVLIAVNLLVALFCAFAYYAFTANMVVEAGVGRDATDVMMSGGGLRGSMHRYGFCVVAALIVQAVMLILNLSVLQYIESRAREANRICVFLGLAGFVVTTAFSAVLIAFGTS